MDALEPFDVLLRLLPGFLAAWIISGLVPRYKPSPFDRTVEALIFTGIVQALTLVAREVLLFAGARMTSFGSWTADAELVTSYILALLLALGISHCYNNDTIHRRLRRLKLTRIASHPSQWFAIFCERNQYVILHLRDGRRVYGWPLDWPDFPEQGEFLLLEVEWLSADKKGKLVTVSLGPEDAALLVHAQDVQFVEFVPFRDNGAELEG